MPSDASRKGSSSNWNCLCRSGTMTTGNSSPFAAWIVMIRTASVCDSMTACPSFSSSSIRRSSLATKSYSEVNPCDSYERAICRSLPRFAFACPPRTVPASAAVNPVRLMIRAMSSAAGSRAPSTRSPPITSAACARDGTPRAAGPASASQRVFPPRERARSKSTASETLKRGARSMPASATSSDLFRRKRR